MMLIFSVRDTKILAKIYEKCNTDALEPKKYD